MAALRLPIDATEPLLAHDLTEPTLCEHKHGTGSIKICNLPGHIPRSVLKQRRMLRIRSKPWHTGLLSCTDHPRGTGRNWPDWIGELLLC